MKRLTWVEIGALGILAIIAIHFAATYGAFAGLLVLALLFVTLREFVADHRVDALVDELRAEAERARDQRDEAVALRMRDQIRAGRWS